MNILLTLGSILVLAIAFWGSDCIVNLLNIESTFIRIVILLAILAIGMYVVAKLLAPLYAKRDRKKDQLSEPSRIPAPTPSSVSTPHAVPSPVLRKGAEVEFGGIRWKVLECGQEALLISTGIICECEYSYKNYSSEDQGGWVNTLLHHTLYSIYEFKFSQQEREIVIPARYPDRLSNNYMKATYIDCPTDSLIERLNDDASFDDVYWVKLSDDDSRIAGVRYKGSTMVLRDFELEHEKGARGLINVDISTDERKRLLKVVG